MNTNDKKHFLRLALQHRHSGECPVMLAAKMLDFVYPPQVVDTNQPFSLRAIVDNKIKGQVAEDSVADTPTAKVRKAMADTAPAASKPRRGWREEMDTSFAVFNAEKQAITQPKAPLEPQGRRFKGFADTPAEAIPTPENTGLPAGFLSVLVTICDLMDRANDNEGIRGYQIAERMNVHPANIQKQISGLIELGYVKSKGEQKARRYYALKRPDGSAFKPCEVIIEDGVRIKRCPPRPATDGVGYVEMGS